MKHIRVTTLHGRLDIPDLVPLYQLFREMPVVSISDAQRETLPWANWQAGNRLSWRPGRPSPISESTGELLCFLGRISHEKRADRAVEIARQVRISLRIAAKVVDKDYFEGVVEPLLRDPLVDFVGELGD